MQDNQRLKCPKCLRFYASATALTQHVESQGVRCTIRETDEYGAQLDDITASTAVIAGLHEDETLKYAVHPDFGTGKGMSSAAQRVIDSNAAALSSIDKAKAEYWTNNNPKW
jgi:ribose 5-phosphate isomerase RpiB